MWPFGLQIELTAEHERTLSALTVGESGPGTILHDFQVLLSFLRGRELQVSKTYHLLPRKVLPEINARLARPIEVRLKQPQLKSYPHIQGLYLLLRVTGLGVVGGSPSKPALTIDEDLYASWSNLNPTERYFTLLEAWLLRGRHEVVGERDISHFPLQHFADCAYVIQVSDPPGVPIADNPQMEWSWLYAPGRAGLALMELFGLLSAVVRRPEEGGGWVVEAVCRTPLGEAAFALLFAELFSDLERARQLESPPRGAFGVLQPVFAPYIPAWQHNLQVPPWAFRDGVHVFRASLWRGLWRLIAVPGDLPLDALAYAMLDAYDFDHDHLYRFSYHNRFGVEEHINHPALEEGPKTDEVRIGDVPLPVGQRMVYLFDFGDSWEFEVTLERVDPPKATVRGPVLIDGRGDAPEQYGEWVGVV